MRERGCDDQLQVHRREFGRMGLEIIAIRARYTRLYDDRLTLAVAKFEQLILKGGDERRDLANQEANARHRR